MFERTLKSLQTNRNDLLSLYGAIFSQTVTLREKLKIQVILTKCNKEPIIEAYPGIHCSLLWLFGKRKN